MPQQTQKKPIKNNNCGRNVLKTLNPSVSSRWLISTRSLHKRYKLLLAALLTTPATGLTATDASCQLQLLQSFGWQIVEHSTGHQSAPPASQLKASHAAACHTESAPEFPVFDNEKAGRLRARVSKALTSDTTRCLFNRSLKHSADEATGRIIRNKEFIFPKPGEDPRDPFTPPVSSWLPSTKRGYDIPVQSLTHGIRSLYSEPVVAECASAIQVAQLATLVEHFDDESDKFITPREIGIGVWREFVKSPSIRANKPLLISRNQRKRALKRLAELGQGAFYNQSGYISPVNSSPEYIDSSDNRGQNFLILDITERAVTDLRARQRPLRELNRMILETWVTYNRLRNTGLDMEILLELLEKELLAADTFFSDVTVYIHPLRTGTFAKFLSRQFRYNPRTAYKLEVYEDYQTGYFFDRYVSYRLAQCGRTGHQN